MLYIMESRRVTKKQEIKNGDRGDEDAQVLARKDKGGQNKG